MYRQGDVLIREVPEIPKDVSEVEREDDRIVLAHGEATGHAHAIYNRVAKFFEETTTKRRYLEISAPSRITHEEHAPIELPVGKYEVIRQREYTPEAIRNVAD